MSGQLQGIPTGLGEYRLGVNAVIIGNDYFTDMLGQLHVTESVDNLIGIEGCIGQRVQYAFVEQLHHFPEELPCEIRTFLHQLIGVDTEIADIIPEGTQSDTGIFVKIAFTELKETAEGL